MSRELPKFEVKDSEDYKVVYTTGAFGGLSPNDGRMILYLDRLVTRPKEGPPGKEIVDKIVRERQVEVHMSPATWKSIATWMMGHVKKIEETVGEIPSKEQVEEEDSDIGTNIV